MSPEDTFDKDVLYLPSKIFLFKKSRYETIFKPKNRIIFSKKLKESP